MIDAQYIILRTFQSPQNDTSMDEIRAITLDLDDTLWPIDPVIEAAEQRLYEWLSEHCPRVVRAHDVETMRQIRLLLARENEDIAHDLTEVRRRSLEHLIVIEAAYPRSLVEDAMMEFLEHRNRVEFFPDVMPFLSRVSGSFPLLSISNGNADLRRVGLSELFLTHISARDVGAAKPDAKLFLAACDHLELAPDQVLHIGDHPVQDILGAARVGMRTIWVNRHGARWKEEFSADHEVSSLDQVLDLLPPHGLGDLQ